MGEDRLKEFKIPIKGLHAGEHEYSYTLKDDFFGLFEGDVLERGKVQMLMILDKHEDMVILDFYFSGYINSGCDRCTAAIEVPIEDNNRLWIKFGEEKEEEYEDIVWVSRELSELDVSQYLYEAVAFGIPMMKVYDCENDPNPRCNFKVLDKLKNLDDGGDGDDLGIWSELGKFK